MSESRLLSSTVYRGYVVELVETPSGKFAKVTQNGEVLAGFRETGTGIDAINRACEWVEAQESAG